MKLIVAGVGPGDAGLLSLNTIRAARDADMVLAPCSGEDKPSVAGEALKANVPEIELTPFFFPMTRDAEKRDAELKRRLETLRPKWSGARVVLLPVIGDSALYATGAYLYDVWRSLAPDIELELIPGISAHSLAASRAKKFLAMDDEILCVIPGTAPRDRIEAALRASDAAAVYKPKALGNALRDVVRQSGPWQVIVRVDRAGLADERIFNDDAALEQPDEYLSLLLLRR